jgi:hypothetical protein
LVIKAKFIGTTDSQHTLNQVYDVFEPGPYVVRDNGTFGAPGNWGNDMVWQILSVETCGCHKIYEFEE